MSSSHPGDFNVATAEESSSLLAFPTLVATSTVMHPTAILWTTFLAHQSSKNRSWNGIKEIMTDTTNDTHEGTTSATTY
ncbi:hypothetical protein J7T55_002038 [Diaporthe amygdali]|uniref:uncharacterized protein n=1 Tax=Phomopsis amygdali TaxID=1214568 RepID=UPI0022FEA4DE|nr:uncharacterized protein J7T55_002038 [Diaporthe amygdali]KAJ0108434.1 hypothetical protein J7T55_002038 [Diaporthe amygdali]